MAAHCLFQHVAIGVNEIGFIPALLRLANIQVPILLDRDVAICADLHPVPRHEFANSLIESVFAGEISEGEILGKCRRMKLRADSVIRQDDLDFRSKQKGIARQAIIEWLNPEAVTRDKQGLLFPIPDRECKHSAQMLYAVASVLLV